MDIITAITALLLSEKRATEAILSPLGSSLALLVLSLAATFQAPTTPITTIQTMAQQPLLTEEMQIAQQYIIVGKAQRQQPVAQDLNMTMS